MNAIPLTDPSGVVRAWMCGICKHQYPRWVGEMPAHLVEESRDAAEHCCVCWERDCGRIASHHSDALWMFSHYCDEHAAIRAAAKKADDEAFEARQREEGLVRCSECLGVGCDGCGDDGWVRAEGT